jgi:iron(III) transport system permease protein
MTIAGIYDRHLGGMLLIGSLGLMVFALVVRFLAVAAEPLRAGSSAIEPSLSEAAATLGAGPLRSFVRIDLPLIKRSLIVSGLLVFIEVVKELPLTLILRPFNFDTLATKAFELAGIELLQEASAAAALIVICSMVPVLLLERSLSIKP